MIKEKQINLKSAYIEQIIMWMVIFVGFVWLFFFVIQYATAIRIKDSMDNLSKYAARYISDLNNQTDVPNNINLFINLNNIRSPIIKVITSNNLNCVIAADEPESSNSQSIFIIQGTYKKGFLKDQEENNFFSRVVVYNNRNQAQITCTLDIIIDE
jgi:hypothetical protein